MSLYVSLDIHISGINDDVITDALCTKSTEIDHFFIVFFLSY